MQLEYQKLEQIAYNFQTILDNDVKKYRISKN